VEKRTVLNLLRIAGDACEQFLEQRIQNVPVRELELDECWSYVGKKEGHKWPEEMNDSKLGDAYTYIALARESRLVVAWHLGKRDRANTEAFVSKIRRATSQNEFDVSTDAFIPYSAAIDYILSDRANHSQVLKVYDKPEEGRERYSPGEFVTVEKKAISGNPNLSRAGTSHVERKNGSLRQWCKRLTRLTYAFSRKWENLRAALAIHFCYYNFCRIHTTLGTTPALEAGITDRLWSLEELVSTL
jgi:IS1 family transposase